MKKLFAVLLVVAMIASLVSFASADGDYTIRIYSNSSFLALPLKPHLPSDGLQHYILIGGRTLL